MKTTSLDQYLRDVRQSYVVPVTAQLLADQYTPVSLLQRFYTGKPGVFLLESVEGGEKWGRYSFLGIEAHAFIEIHEQTVVVRKMYEDNKEFSKQEIAHNGQPLETLRELMKAYHCVRHDDLPRFFGGLVGYFSYEMASFFEKIPHKLENEPFANFVIPKTILILDNVKQTLTICVLTFPNENKEIPPEKHHQKAVETLNRIGKELRQVTEMTPLQGYGDIQTSPTLSERDYRRKVEVVKEHIIRGDIIQCVISQQFVSDTAPDAISLYRALRFANPAPYLFFMHLGETVLAGSSPETMIRLDGRKATLRPIAGTRRRGANERQDRELSDEILRDAKEKAEHLMLVDLGRNDLGRVAKTGSVQVTDLMFVERHPHVMHLVSNITAELEDGLDGFDLFRATFPAGTLTGAPKIRAMQIIAEQEDKARGPYGGAAGYISFDGNIDFAITIRTARITHGKLIVQAGGGVVYDSIAESERLETVNKAMGITRALDILEEIP